MLPIIRLPANDSRLIQSTTCLPTYPSVLKELIDNAIDAQASHIDCWINPSSWSMRVVDDGFGISREDIKGSIGCERGMSSKFVVGKGRASETFLGFRGQALASMGTIASLEIISRRRGFASTYHKVIKNGKPLSCGPTERYARAAPGTAVIVKDMYHSVPVRRNSNQKEHIPSLIQACTKVIESTILSFPSAPGNTTDRRNLSITLTLEGNAAAGIPSRRLLGLEAGTDVVATFASTFGDGLTTSSKSFRASADGVHVRGFLGLAGHATRAHQYLFVNGHLSAKSELCDVVVEAYAAADVFGRESADEEEVVGRGEMALQKSGKKGSTTRSKTCHPVFLLHLELPRSEVDHSLEPLKNSVMFKDAALVQRVLRSVVRNVLRSAGFMLPKSSETTCPPRSKPDAPEATPAATRQPVSHPLQPIQRSNVPAGPLLPSSSYLQPKRHSITAKLDHNRLAPGSVEEPRKTTPQPPGWLSKALSDRAQQVFPASTSASLPKSIRLAQPLDKQDCDRADISPDDFGLERLQLTKLDLQNAKVIAQVDDKFICCAIPNSANQPGSVLVLVDQHAADERIRVERFLGQLLREFEGGAVAATLLELPHDVQLFKEQVAFLADLPESQHLLARWGFQVSGVDSASSSFACISVDSVPTLLLSRLGAKGNQEVKKIVTEYIAFLQTQPITSLASFAAIQCDRMPPGLDSPGLLRWMPARMKELVDSKACRGAIMFNDPLTLEKCNQLIQQLGQTSFPFICAHGRPSICPLARLAPRPDSSVAQVVDSTTKLPSLVGRLSRQ